MADSSLLMGRGWADSEGCRVLGLVRMVLGGWGQFVLQVNGVYRGGLACASGMVASLAGHVPALMM
jgi:hypothetical protein